ncbi:MAG: tetratricopeptide repeat protein [Phenylobacterium sp.]|uniref:tetratricopeptide repeat protein n=1 Tax=Phenylobacterium sp. TaxID=1871053 RepID=UPI001A43AED7|nr:tetratricopeptide repeat protein [Phenylobacterium sp.]MBL8554062.1 tetratricopeptide repeat protein [Phenylobacterium sp.]
MRLFRTLLVAGALATIAAAGLGAAGAMAAGGGGGGGGGGSMPSASGASYDPAEEYAKAIKAIQAKEYKKAAVAAGRVTDAAPKSVDAWRLLGVAQAGAENWKGARRAYERVVRLDPDDLAGRAGLGMALGNLKDPKAREQLDWLKAKAASCGADCATVKALAAEVEKSIAGGGSPAASAALEGGSLIFADAGDHAYVEAVSLINEKRYDDALASLDRARRAFGPHPDVLTYQGYAWRRKGALDKAESYYRQALAIAPDHRGATEYYGELKVERGDRAGAQAMLARLDRICAYGCAEAEELRRWIDAGGEPGR